MGVNLFRAMLLVSASAATAVLAVPTAAYAQQQNYQIDIPEQPLGDALRSLGRATRQNIVFDGSLVRGKRSAAIRGRMTVDEALGRLLQESGLSFRKMKGGAYAVSAPNQEKVKEAVRAISDIDAARGYVNGQPNIPEILVLGQRSWSLNTDIPRGKDEAQPYTVFTREEIKRSGAADLDTFFRDFLGANTGVSTASQRDDRDSLINLRGLGPEGTLILVDGRRIADPNLSPNNALSGRFVQSSIMGIPLDQIERVEVLASSAAGQYGSNAVGGVINIILRRDFKGVELSGYVGGTTDGHAIERRLGANYSFPLLKNKFSVTVSGSWSKTDPLFARDRPFTQDRIEHILENNPNYFAQVDPATGLIYSTTPNIVSTGGNLTLKPQYAVNGVTALNSRYTFIPVGFEGRPAVGNAALGAALLANAGRQNLEPGPGTSVGVIYGDRYPLTGAGERRYLSLTTRGEITDWLSLYASGSYSRYQTRSEFTPVPESVGLLASSPLNPFNQSIQISVPNDEYEISHSTITNKKLVGGLIVKLPYKWQANFDVVKDWGTSQSRNGERRLSRPFTLAFQSGQIDVLRDTLAYPIPPEFEPGDHYARQAPSKSTATSYSLKLAGPLGFARLPGGQPVVTLNGETRRQAFGDSVYIVDSPISSGVNYSPKRSQSSDSLFAELVLPLVGATNNVPLVHNFELRISGRYDRYVGVGSRANFVCLANIQGFLTSEQISGACPPAGVTIPYETTRNSSINPVVAAKWSVTPDLALRGSYSTGYTPPVLSNLVANPPTFVPIAPDIANFVPVGALDPLRGNEPIGREFGFPPLFSFRGVDGLTGGNPDVDPQKSKSLSFGAILTPRFVPGLTLRADWTKITIRNAYFLPLGLITGNTPETQAGFNDFLAAFPERFRRAAPAANDPYSVGRITYIDATVVNLSYNSSEAIDFSADYRTDIGNGTLSVTGSGTLLLDLKRRLTDSAPLTDLDGVVSVSDFAGLGNSLRVRGTLTANYATDKWSVGARARYFSGYYLSYQNIAGEYPVNVNQGSNRVGGAAFFDLFGSVNVRNGTELRAGINNIFNTRSPTDVTRSLGYAPYGDPRLRNFFVSLTQRI